MPDYETLRVIWWLILGTLLIGFAAGEIPKIPLNLVLLKLQPPALTDGISANDAAFSSTFPFLALPWPTLN